MGHFRYVLVETGTWSFVWVFTSQIDSTPARFAASSEGMICQPKAGGCIFRRGVGYASDGALGGLSEGARWAPEAHAIGTSQENPGGWHASGLFMLGQAGLQAVAVQLLWLLLITCRVSSISGRIQRTHPPRCRGAGGLTSRV